MIFKKIAAICFALAFVLAIGVFTNYFQGFISKYNAKYGIVVVGGIALLMNLLSFKYDSKSDNNIIFWIGLVVIFSGLILKMSSNPLNPVVLIAGMLIVALSYFFNPFDKRESNEELLDN
jgi:chromate transport protein ChrA